MEQQNTAPQAEIFQNVPPHDDAAELAVLGAMFLDREAASLALEMLTGEDFYRPDHRQVFEAAEELYHSGVPIDMITVKNKLEEKQVFEQIGGLPFLANISTSVGSSANMRHYAAIVEEKSVLRRLIRTANNISQMSYEGKTDVNAIMDTAEKGIFDIMQNRHSDQFHHIRDIAVDSIEKIEDIYRSKGKLTGVPTGFVDFDQKTAGLQKSDLILLAARPSMGKTAFALNIIQNAAIRSNVPTAVFSLEMSREQLVNRMLCSEAMLDAQRLRTGELTDSDWADLIQAMGPLSQAPIYIDDTPGVTPMEVRSKCRRLKVEKGLGLIVIDYLQLMSGNGRTDSRQQEISEISRSLKAIAREMEAPVIALSQLSRACEQRADHRPMLSDLRESGAIEQDADVVAFLYRDEYYFPDTEKKNQAELIIAKQRNGPTGTVDLTWMGQYTKFGNFLKKF
ncbi:replicative DNA helicase [Anaerotignum sp.]|uniref:replicative DNA helicase n=2 Tax=Anaerotignum sp. TaxID=2039241 RepID=UPI002A916EEB|nr:replicative DNA helicase [Anaerotignum sp.]MCI7657843.1 replicative DNA helicase [Clostridia bacterium]MDY5415776.1 replicative DNA helicase [Anaerotignum sp.]